MLVQVVPCPPLHLAPRCHGPANTPVRGGSPDYRAVATSRQAGPTPATERVPLSKMAPHPLRGFDARQRELPALLSSVVAKVRQFICISSTVSVKHLHEIGARYQGEQGLR
jgi:hypothetical protein